MRYKKLGQSDLSVSQICLGSMTWGQQNTKNDAHSQLDFATQAGVNFFDTAEMYPVPARAETQGSTESHLGSWLKCQAREKFVIATKVAGPARGMDWVRGEPLQVNPAQIVAALEGSLKRLQTDYVDLYQIHWPARYVPMFGQSHYEPALERPSPAIDEQLQTLAGLVRSGKIRYIGVSNETSWGVCQFTRLADQLGLPKIVSIQNAYNLINRAFEWGLTETCRHEQVGLLAYSPLAFGLLSGKYAENPQAEGRMTLFPNFGQRYLKPNVPEAVAAYVQLARNHGLSPAQLALAFVQSRWFVASTVIGATSLAQLQENIGSQDITLSGGLLAQIEAIHRRYPSPAQ